MIRSMEPMKPPKVFYESIDILQRLEKIFLGLLQPMLLRKNYRVLLM